MFGEKLQNVDFGPHNDPFPQCLCNKNFPYNSKTVNFIQFLMPVLRCNFRKV